MSGALAWVCGAKATSWHGSYSFRLLLQPSRDQPNRDLIPVVDIQHKGWKMARVTGLLPYRAVSPRMTPSAGLRPAQQVWLSVKRLVQSAGHQFLHYHH